MPPFGGIKMIRKARIIHEIHAEIMLCLGISRRGKLFIALSFKMDTSIGRLDSAIARQIVLNVSNYFEKNSGKKEGHLNKTVEATGVSRRTVSRVRQQYKETGSVQPPPPTPRTDYKPVDDFDRTVIRNKVNEFYTVRKQLPTLSNMHVALQADINFPGGKSTLRKILRQMGFRFRKTTTNRKVLVERTSVVSQRLQFYRRRKELLEAGFKLVYIDETWIDTAYCAKSCWQGPTTSGVIAPCNRGQRLIVVHAGCRDGFIPGAQLIYKASSSSGDYHSQMDGGNFTRWIQQMLPNLDCPCAIVMDNASYHSIQTDRAPTSSSRKADIKVMQWYGKIMKYSQRAISSTDILILNIVLIRYFCTLHFRTGCGDMTSGSRRTC